MRVNLTLSGVVPVLMLAFSIATARAQQAPLYAHATRAVQWTASALLTLPRVASNKSWYANWIMLAGESGPSAQQMFVQVGMIRRAKDDPDLHVFVAWRGADSPGIEYRQYGHLAEGPHRFSIAQNADSFALFADDREVARVRLTPLAHAQRAYFEIGPEVEAEGDLLSGEILNAAWRTNDGWDGAADRQLCRYENHGLSLRYEHGAWNAHGRFNRALPSAYDGACGGI